MNRLTMRVLVCLWLLGSNNFLAAAPQTPGQTAVSSLADFQNMVIRNGRLITSFHVEGSVCAVEPNHKWMVLQDESATVLLELPNLDGRVQPGDRVSVYGKNSTLTRGEFGIQIGTAPVVDVDGLHAPKLRSGSVFLEAGRHPFHLEWFNGYRDGLLALEYAGPGVKRQSLPSSAFWWRDAGTKKFLPGLDFTAYVGNGWNALPDFQKLEPAAQGVATNFDLRLRTQPEQAALVFSGFLEVPTTGIYTFYDRSDDGSRLYIAPSATAGIVVVLSHQATVPKVQDFASALIGPDDSRWAKAEGKVQFASHRGNRLELELVDQGISIPVTVADGDTLDTTNLLHRRVQATGICQVTHGAQQEVTARLVALSTNGIKILNLPRHQECPDLLTSAGEIRSLQKDEAQKNHRVKVCGVVTMSTYWSLVLQDATGGVFIQYDDDDSANRPRSGELWEITGKTDPGDFSPIILADHGICLGRAALPEAVQPTREQLMNGSLDADRVEIQGTLTDITASEMELLTRDGRIRILSKDCYPLPAIPDEFRTGGQLLGSIVRLRGVFAAKWNESTLQVEPGNCFIGNSLLSVDELAPRDPFLMPAKRAADLLLFTSHVGALTRVKVTGQVVFAQPREYILQDGATGLRVQTREPLPLHAGDLVEAVGFPRLGGPSPVLLEANLRKTGSAHLPVPAPVAAEDLGDAHLDARLVQIEARLLSDETRQGERVLEMRAGPNHFLARMDLDDGTTPALRPGSLLRLDGIYSVAHGDLNAGGHVFELLLNHPSDIVVLQQGPWWTRHHTIAVIAVLSGGLSLALAWGALLRRTVAQRTAQLEKEIEKRQVAELSRVMEQERTRVAQDLHDELGAGLAEVGILGSLARNPAIALDKKAGYLERLTDLSRLLVAGLDEIVWAINPMVGSTASVSSYLCDYAQEFLQPTAIGCRLDVARAWPGQALNSSQRHQLFLAFKEALTNIVKHAGATEVWIRMRVDQGDLCVTVEDNGRGLPLNGTPRGDGLANMRSRLTKIGGTCEFHSRPEGGVIVHFRLPADVEEAG